MKTRTLSAYTHPQPNPPPTQQPDTAPGPYYVSLVFGPKFALLSGPYPTHPEALAMVEPARAVAVEHCVRAAFASFGTVRCKPDCTSPGRLQQWGYDLQCRKIPTPAPKPKPKPKLRVAILDAFAQL